MLVVAVSPRRNTFHQRAAADGRACAALAVGAFLVAIGIAGFLGVAWFSALEAR